MKENLTKKEIIDYLDNLVKIMTEKDWHDELTFHPYHEFKLVILTFLRFELITSEEVRYYFDKEEEANIRRVRITSGKYKGMVGKLRDNCWEARGKQATVQLEDIYYKPKRVSWSCLEFYRKGKWCENYK